LSIIELSKRRDSKRSILYFSGSWRQNEAYRISAFDVYHDFDNDDDDDDDVVDDDDDDDNNNNNNKLPISNSAKKLENMLLLQGLNRILLLLSHFRKHC
jgi:hypothetical protein